MKNLEDEESGLPESLVGQAVECQTCQHPFELKREDLDRAKFKGTRSAGVVNMIYLDWVVPCPRCLNPVVVTETTFA